MPTSRAAGCSTCAPPERGRCWRRVSSALTRSTCAPRATASCSSRTAGTAPAAASRGCSLLSPAEIRERYDGIRAAVGPGVTIVAATKYVALADLGVLVEAGIEVVGENRVQDL